VLAVLAIGGAATGVILRSGDRPGAAPTIAPLPAPTSVPAAAPALSAQPTAPSTADAVDLLREQLDADTATVESLVGKWIPQLSSKREGDLVDGTRYDAAAILDDFTSWKKQVPSSVLTRSERFTSFRGSDYWVTLAAEPFDTAEAANAWCEAQGIAPGDCFAERLSYTEGPGGNTVPR
jgi:serine/threonine-protein kinase